MIQDEKINLRPLLLEIYDERNKDVREENLPDKSNFVGDETKKLKSILRNLSIDLDKFKVDKGTYEVPMLTAEVFKQYLLEDSSKGGFISKIKNGMLYKITVDEKLVFIEKVIAGLKKRVSLEENNNTLNRELDDLRNRFINELYFFEKIKAKMTSTKLLANMIIEAGFIQMGGITELEGMILVNDDIHYEDNKYDEKTFYDMESISDYSKNKYRIDLSQKDREELMNYFSVMLKHVLGDWKQISDIACEIRSENILEGDEEYIQSNDLIKMAISEYKEALNKKRIVKNIPDFNNEEMKKILEEIKLENERRKESSH